MVLLLQVPATVTIPTVIYDAATVGLNVPSLIYLISNSKCAGYYCQPASTKKVNSVFGYADIGYKNMVYLGVTGRNDWTTTLQKPNNSYFYPSASLGIIPSNMLKMPEFFTYVKLRASWAQVSSDNISLSDNIYQNTYATLPTYQAGPSWNGTQLVVNNSGYVDDNQAIQPNTTISKEYGTELRFLTTV